MDSQSAIRRIKKISCHCCSSVSSHEVKLNYRRPPTNGKYAGRYIGIPDRGDAIDDFDAITVNMQNARQLRTPAELETMGFTLAKHPTKVKDFQNDEEVTTEYYDEIIDLVKRSSGATRVFIFDHTVRHSAATSMNSLEKGAAAAALPRVHCDYTDISAPARLEQLSKAGIYSRLKQRVLTEEEMGQIAKGRFSFINVWRSIDAENPILQMPLAVCDPKSVSPTERFLYTMFYADRVGENYGLTHSDKHQVSAGSKCNT
jgi:hypothetical protein